MYVPQHGMSERALEADWNVFVWSENRICMGECPVLPRCDSYRWRSLSTNCKVGTSMMNCL